MTVYDFGLESDTYDLYYETEYGREVDRREKKCIEKCFSGINRENVLEIGCGTGHWTNFFSENGFKLKCIDYSPKMLEKAINKNIPNAEFSIGNASNLEFAAESFDSVFSITCLEFVADRAKAFSEIYRVLKPKGILLLAVLNQNSQLAKSKSEISTFENAHFYTKNELKDLLSDYSEIYINDCAKLNDDAMLVLDDENDDHEGMMIVVKAMK